MDKLKRWENAADQGEERSVLANQIRQTYETNAQELNISHHNITSLPDLDDLAASKVTIENCPELKTLPKLPKITTGLKLLGGQSLANADTLKNLQLEYLP